MVLRKISFPLALAAILAGCTAETEFNPIGGSESKNNVSKTDDIGDDEGSSSSKKSSSSEGNSSEYEDFLVVSSYEDLLVCSAKRDGMDAYVKAEKSFYICDDGEWVKHWEIDDVKENSSSSSAGDLNSDQETRRMLDSILASFSSSSYLIMPGLSSSSVFFPSMSSSSVMNPNISSSSYITTTPTYLSHHGVMAWEGYIGEYYVNTELDNGTESAGYWYSFDDSVDGGKSRIEWPAELGNEYDALAMDPVIDECNGVCGTFILDAGTLAYKPFVGIAFNVAGFEEGFSGPIDVADASAWGGLCIVYSVDVNAVLELSMGEERDKTLGFDIPYVNLPKSATGNEDCRTWDQFKQAGWGTGKITGGEIAKTLGAVRFKIQAADGTTGNFNVMSIGSYF